MAAIDGPRSKAEVDKILDRLDATAESTDSRESEKLLKQLHASTRMLPDAALQPLYSSRGVRVLGRYGFKENPTPDHLPALRCLNNVLVRSSESRKLLSAEIGAGKIVAALKRDDPKDELALANILIFSCDRASLDLTSSFENDGLAETVNAVRVIANRRAYVAIRRQLETLAERFLDSVDPVLEMLSRMAILTPPLQAPVSILVNCLPVLPLQKKEQMSAKAMEKLVEILGSCIDSYGTQDKETEFLPLLLALNHISQSEAAEAKAQLQNSFIPTEEDRKEALGKGSTLPHKLLHLSNMSMFPEVREVIMTIFFQLSDKDASRFVHNVGFGNAAGYLSTKGIEISQKDLSEAAGAADVNPITGQRVDAESQPDLPEMTEEEKEREAERLFVLFERLRATGVVDVENPVTAAAQSGRIQELPDDASDDDDGKQRP